MDREEDVTRRVVRGLLTLLLTTLATWLANRLTDAILGAEDDDLDFIDDEDESAAINDHSGHNH